MTGSDDSVPNDFEGYNQRPCPNCGHQESHMPFEYTESMVCSCGECGYAFLKHPSHLDKPSLNAVPIAELEQLADEFIKQRTGNAEVDQAYENAGSRIYRLIADYRGDEGE